MNKVCKNELRVRILLLISVVMYSVGMWGLGYTPTDGGLVVDLQRGQRILLSVMIDDDNNPATPPVEYFVCHYPSKTGGHFGYTNWDSEKGNFLKLFPQDAGATEPATPSIWTIDDPLPFLKGGNSYPLDGIAYTMWSTNPGGDSYTLLTSSNNNWKYQGDLTREKNNANACDVIFVVPTNHSSSISFDPKKTLTTYCGRTDQDSEGRFNGENGFGFLGKPYREVYMMVIPRSNEPIVYGNAALVGFNITRSNYNYNNGPTAKPGQALFAFNDRPKEGEKYVNTKRTIFRLYILDDPLVSSCPDSYFFAYDEQDFKGYRMGPGNEKDNVGKTWTDSTEAKKIYTIDRLVCMERIPDTKYHVSDYMYVPIPDSTYYYVGYKNKYCHTDQGDAFNSQFKNIDTLKLQHMDKPAPRGAFGRMIVDTTQTSKQNLGVTFRPAGVFLRVDAGGGRYRNIEMHPEPGDTSWICNEMWTITDEYAALTIKATLYSGAEFSDEDPGIDIPEWSEYVVGNTVPLADDPSSHVTGDMTGWARVYTNKSTTNGGLEFVRAEKDKYVRYDNNGHFGVTIPNTHAKAGETEVVLSEARLLDGYEFLGWYTKADTTTGSFTKYKPGNVVDLSAFAGDSLILYAQAKYTGSISVALSFIHPTDGKRYFLTHPNSDAPRYAKARHFTDWTDTYQGMSDANNTDSRFLSTYLIVGNNTVCEECADGEYVLDPRRETAHGAVDSVMFYEHFSPANEEYIGLYYVAGEFNKILANDTWAGLFQSTKGWPDPMSPCIDSTKLYSTHYLSGYPSTITRHVRPNNEEGDTVYYNPATGFFDGKKSPVTNFTISGVGVVDEHYVVLPDTTVEWTDTITFGIHQDEHIENPVWSKLIGKQLMLQMMVGDKITYFHPNENKIITEYTQMRLNGNYRLDETFEYIRDARVESLGEAVLAEDKPTMNDRLEKNYFGRLLTSGLNTPMNVLYRGEYIDIIDTIRITLRPIGPTKIKEYYGRWKEGAPGLHIRPDGSHYRDIIVRTKTLHYGPDEIELVLTPEYPSYNFTPLAGNTKQLNFTLTKVTSHKLLDSDGNVIREEIISEEDVTTSLNLGPGFCRFTSGSPSAYFNLPEGQTISNHVTLVTKKANASGVDHDTLVINLTATIDAVTYPVTGRVPLLQSTLEGTELVWSAVVNKKRYFIMAGSGGLIYREFKNDKGVLYTTDGKQLIKGSANAENSDTRYITPWKYTYVDQSLKQLSLETEYYVNKKFIVSGETTPGVGDDGAAVLTYEYVKTNVDNDANFEEQVRIRYGDPGTGKWLKLDATPSLTLTSNLDEATIFYWTYLKTEYSLREQDAYPSVDQLVFGYNSTSASVRACYKARRQYAMLLDSVITYCSVSDTYNLSALTNPSGEWKTNKLITIKPDARPGVPSSGLSISGTDAKTQTTTIEPSGDSPMEVRSPAGTGPFVNIVDTLYMEYSLQDGAPDYVFKSTWAGFKSIEEANLKIPLIRKTYHAVPYDSLICFVEGDEHNYVFPAVVDDETDDHEFVLGTDHRIGTTIYDVDNNIVSVNVETEDEHTDLMNLTDIGLAEIRLIDEYGNTPDWCVISDTSKHTITIHCKGNGIRSPRSANVYVSYLIYVNDKWRFVHFRFQVAQSSQFQIAGNQSLIHSKGASGMPLVNGSQQVHENRTILYYYNVSNTAQSTDQRVELPIRERNFYGWWRWYSLQPGEEDTDIPAARWQTAPTNNGKWDFPFRIIGDSVPVDPEDPSKGKKLVTQGRYTVFHVPSKDYNRKDPPSKAPSLYPPQNKAVERYAVDLSVYYDNLPLSMANVNQVDMAKMDTMQNIIEPTLSLREIYELHPWTEMAERLEGYKDTIDHPTRNLKYMEDHVVRAPLNNRLLLKTEQRYNYDNLKKGQHSESLLGYYMRDDNWSTAGWDDARKDSMIWCGGWDADCKWYTYNPKNQTYALCKQSLTEANDFLSVPAKTSITAGHEFDTVYYCLRARSWSTTGDGTTESPDTTVAGDYWFNICRYTVIYHRTDKYGPKLEEDGKAIMTNTEIEEKYDVLERLNFDYNKPGSDYTVYPHPLPWADASYGFAYPRTASLPDNRPHNVQNDGSSLANLANMGEYNLINRIPSFGKFWHKMEQHGGAANGYMIFCDGMSSAGQVAALSLESHLCEGQRLYFSAYVGNPGSEKDKTCPSFTFSVQGKTDELGAQWEDITSYMTGDLPQSNKWYQIYFPIEQEKKYENFRVRVYNMAANDDGNDFIIDDMCIFATKPPLMVYQANTTCKADNEADSLTHVVLRLDYQGFTEDMYEGSKISTEYYTIVEVTKTNDTSFLKLEDKYYNEDTLKAVPPHTKDTLYGKIPLPDRYYHPLHEDSIFPNLQELVFKFEKTFDAHEAHVKDPSKPDTAVFREGYIYEHLDDTIRPVLYIIHSAKMSGDNRYVVHMAGDSTELMSSRCAMTRDLRVRNRIMLALNGEEQPEKEVTAMCNNTTYDVSLHVKGTLLLDSVAPIEVIGTCYNDWLLYGDTTKATSESTYGYKYDDIVKVVRDILRAENEFGTNSNRFAKSLAEVRKNEMKKVQRQRNVELSVNTHPHTILSWLVNKGYLTLYQSSMTITTPVDSTVKYTIFPIPGTGSQVMQDMNIEVCPTPIQIALTSSIGGGLPLIIGGLKRPEAELGTPITVLADETHANSELAIPIDSLMLKPGYDIPEVALDTIVFLSSNDPEYREGIHTIALMPDRTYKPKGENPGYYRNGNDTLVVMVASSTNYRMRQGYSYTFGIEMMTSSGGSSWTGSEECPVGTIPFTISVVPDYLRWDPHDEDDSRWNNPNNWIGINPDNTLIHETANFAPFSTTHVVIPPMTDGRKYPVLPKLDTLKYADSIQMVGFQYNTCKSIRFLPGAAMSQQQHLEYDSVIADLSAPNRKWALRTSPIEGLLSGDLYMANADLSNETPLWAVGPFDANGRNYKTGNATFWLSLYSRAVNQYRLTEEDTTYTSAADWSVVTNDMRLHLKPGQGWAVYTRTKSDHDAALRLPKNDDIYYYYTNTGKIVWDRYESGLREERAKMIDPSDPAASEKVGKLAFYPGKSAISKDYTLTNGTDSRTFVFGNPTMGYIDIWGFIADNTSLLEDEFRYIKADGLWEDVTKSSLEGDKDTIVSLKRYLPPMQAIELKKKGDESTSIEVTLKTNRIVTDASQIDRAPAPDPAPKRLNGEAAIRRKGIMTVTAVNPVSPRCTSRLLLGQGFNEAVLRGEDAVLTTVNIDNFSMTNAPATPFNIYALEGNSGLSIDLRDEIVNVPISFYNSDLPFEPNSYLWFTGVNNIDGDLVLYDALLDIERPILDGICLEIETPETSHIKRYYIRRPGYVPGQTDENPIATGFTNLDGKTTSAVKFIRNGHVFILRDGHVYSIYGQKIR